MSIAKLSQLPLAIAPSEPDLLGWPVLGSDETLAGTVVDLLVQQDQHDARYLVVQLTNGNEVPIPIGEVSIIEGEEARIVARHLSAAALRKIPPLPPEPLDTGREQQIFATFLPHHTVDYNRPEFLWGGERAFHLEPLPEKPYENKFVPTPQGREGWRGKFS